MRRGKNILSDDIHRYYVRNIGPEKRVAFIFETKKTIIVVIFIQLWDFRQINLNGLTVVRVFYGRDGCNLADSGSFKIFPCTDP